jgi:hypothetical protein
VIDGGTVRGERERGGEEKGEEAHVRGPEDKRARGHEARLR